MKRHQCSYDYIEVMACPSGCLNGGGQPKQQRLSNAAELLQLVEEAHQQVSGFRKTEQRDNVCCFRTSS